MANRDNGQRGYSSHDNKELAERHDRWASTYDDEMERDVGYHAPQAVARIFARHVPKKARVLDAGAGTGLVGEVLSSLGYRDLVAMDLSRGMLEKARNKGVYQELHQMVMGEPLDFATDSFGAVVSVGAIGYAPASSLDELVRITRPGGHIVFTLRPKICENSRFKDKQASLESEGRWKLTEISEQFQVQPKREPDAYHRVWVCRVMGPPLAEGTTPRPPAKGLGSSRTLRERAGGMYQDSCNQALAHTVTHATRNYPHGQAPSRSIVATSARAKGSLRAMQPILNGGLHNMRRALP